MMAMVKALLLLTVIITAAPKPTDTPTATPAPTQTARVIIVVPTAPPTDTPTPSPTSLPTGVYTGTVPGAGGSTPGAPSGGPGLCFGPLGCIGIFDLLAAGVGGLIGWVTGGIDAVVHGISSLFTAVVRVDQWAELAGFLAFLQTAALGMAGSFLVFGVVLQLRGTVWGNDAGAALVGAAMMGRAIEAAILIPATVWIIGQILDLAQAVSDLLTNHAGHAGGAQLIALGSAFLSLTNPLELVAGVVGVVVLLLVLLIKLMSVAILAWMACVGVLAMATWPMGSRIVARWFWNFTAVALWGAGWAIWLKIVEVVLTDFSLGPDPALAQLMRPFIVVAVLLFGYGVPRAVDQLLGSAMAGHGSGIAGFAVGVGTAVATSGAGGLARTIKGKLF